MMHARVVALTVVVAATCGAQSSQQPRFDVASIKPATQAAMTFQGGPGSTDPGRVSYSRATLAVLIMDAFHVRNGQISGPPWLTTEYFAVNATMPPMTTPPEYSQMLENLLVERFHFVYHRETSEDPGYELVVGKQGPKISRSVLSAEDEQVLGCAPPVTINRLRAKREGDRFNVTVINCSMGAFAGLLASLVGRVDSRPGESTTNESFIVNKTELPGKYSFQFEFAPELSGLQAALESKIGLRLVERKIAREHIVVDHIDKMPTEN